MDENHRLDLIVRQVVKQPHKEFGLALVTVRTPAGKPKVWLFLCDTRTNTMLTYSQQEASRQACLFADATPKRLRSSGVYFG